MDLVPLLVNGWKVFGRGWAYPRARMFQGTVYLEGLVTHDNPVPGLIATLPIEFRPKAGTLIFTANQHDSDSTARIDVRTNGDIWLYNREGNYKWIPLDNVVYRV